MKQHLILTMCLSLLISPALADVSELEKSIPTAQELLTQAGVEQDYISATKEYEECLIDFCNNHPSDLFVLHKSTAIKLVDFFRSKGNESKYTRNVDYYYQITIEFP